MITLTKWGKNESTVEYRLITELVFIANWQAMLNIFSTRAESQGYGFNPRL